MPHFGGGTNARTLRGELERTRDGRLNPTGRIMFQDDFSKGFCGWELLAGESMQMSQGQGYEMGRMALGQYGDHSLMLMSSGVAADAVMAIKRTTIQRLCKLGLEVWYVWQSGNENQTREVRFGFDMQEPHPNVAFSWPLVRYLNYYGAAYHRKWQYQSGPRSARVFTDIPDGGQWICRNQWGKYNWNYLKLVIDLGKREYVSLVSNDKTFDMRGLPIVVEAVDPTLYNLLNPVIGITPEAAARVWLWFQRPTLTIEDV